MTTALKTAQTLRSSVAVAWDGGPADRQKAAALPQKPTALPTSAAKERGHPEPGNLRAVHPFTLHACLGKYLAICASCNQFVTNCSLHSVTVT